MASTSAAATGAGASAVSSDVLPINTPSIGADFGRLIVFISVISCGIRHLRMPGINEIITIIPYYDRNAMREEEAKMRYDMWQAATESGAGLASTIRDYLSSGHRDNPGRGCPTSALVAEIARHPKAARDAFTDKIAGIIELIAAHLDSGTQRERRRKAVAVYGLMVGTLQLARAVNDKRLSEEILQSGAEQALALASQRGK